MTIDRSFTRVLVAWISIVAILIAGNSNVVRCHAIALDLGDDVAPYPKAMDSNGPQILADQGSIVAWGSPCIDSSLFKGQFRAIAAGSVHSLALKTDGSIVGWGENWFGQATSPDGNDFIAIAAGGSHSLAIRRQEPVTKP